MNNKVIIFGSDHHNTLGVVRSFFYKGLRPYVVVRCQDPSKSFVLKSKHIAGGAAFKSYEDCVAYIEEQYAEGEDKAVMIVTADGAESYIDRHYDRLRQYFSLPGSVIQGRITTLMNKETMSQLALECGLKVARTWTTKDGQVIEGPLEYPCITKSIMSIQGGKENTAILYNEDDLHRFFEDENHSKNIQIQKFIEKEFEFQFIGVSLKGGEEIIIPGRTRIQHLIRENTSFLEFDNIDSSFDATLRNCKEFIKTTGYSGLFSAEFLRGKDGVDYFMEINFRNDGNAICATASGCNLPYIWYLWNIGENYLQEVPSRINKIFLMPEFDDAFLMLKGKIRFFDWIHDIFKANCYITYYKEDPKPFWILFKSNVQFLLKRLLRMG